MDTRGLKLFGALVATAIVVLVAAMIVARVATPNEASARRQVEAEIAAIKARGEPVSWADLQGPKIPDSRNGAVVYARAIRSLESANEYYLRGNRGMFFGGPRWVDRQRMRQWRGLVEKHKSIVSLIEEAVSKPKCEFPVRWEDGNNVSLHHHIDLRMLGNFLSMKVMVDADSGRTDNALHTIELILRMSDATKNEPDVTGQLARMNTVTTALRSLVTVAKECPIDEAGARRLYGVAGKVDLSKSAAIGLQWHRVLRIDLIGYYQTYGQLPAGFTDIPSWWASRSFYADTLYSLRKMKDNIAQSWKPYRVLCPNGSVINITAPFPYSLSATTMPSMEQFAGNRDRAIARLALIKAVLALTVYKCKYARYPDSLAEAASTTGFAIPDDPFTGKSLVYRKQGKGFVAYSVDYDLVDDGGFEPVSRFHGSSSTKHDIVAKVDR